MKRGMELKRDRFWLRQTEKGRNLLLWHVQNTFQNCIFIYVNLTIKHEFKTLSEFCGNFKIASINIDLCLPGCSVKNTAYTNGLRTIGCNKVCKDWGGATIILLFLGCCISTWKFESFLNRLLRATCDNLGCLSFKAEHGKQGGIF